MKIGIDGRAAKWYRGTGIGTYTYQLIKSLSSIDDINDYLIFMPKGLKTELSLAHNFTFADISAGCSFNFWDEVNIPNILSDKGIDIYHVPQNGVGLSLEKACPSIITLHDVIPYRLPETVSKRYIKIFSENIPSIVEACEGIITVSNFSKQDIMKAFNYTEDKIQVTYLAAESIYKPMDKTFSKAFLKRKYALENKYILYVGGFSPRKNISGLIRAYSIFADKYNVKLVIAGTRGKSYEDYLELVQNLKITDKVVFPGFIPTQDLPFFYSGAEVFVYPSFYEGFGLPPVEAMACGTPVISSNVTSMPEIIGDAGILVDPKDVIELSKAIEGVLLDKDLWQRLSKHGIKRAAYFSWKKNAMETLSFYNRIMSDIY